MEKNKERVERITQLLSERFEPTELNVIDESHLHAGHAGAKTGLGHFAVSITSSAFANCTPITVHRMIYDALGNMMTTDIHALRIIRASAN